MKNIKALFAVLCLCVTHVVFPSVAQAQITHVIDSEPPHKTNRRSGEVTSYHYINLSPGVDIKGSWFARAEYDIIGSWCIIQGSIFTGTYSGINMKIGFDPTFRNHDNLSHKWRWYVYLPYMNYNIRESKYNTPFCTELFYSINKDFQVSMNVDIYRNDVVPTIKLRGLITSFKY